MRFSLSFHGNEKQNNKPTNNTMRRLTLQQDCTDTTDLLKDKKDVNG